MAEVIRAGLVQQQWTGDKDSMIRASVDAIGRAASAGAQVVCLQELFYGPYFCQVQDADYYSYTEAIPGGSDHPAHVRRWPGSTRWCWWCRCTRRSSPGCTTTPRR